MKLTPPPISSDRSFFRRNLWFLLSVLSLLFAAGYFYILHMQDVEAGKSSAAIMAAWEGRTAPMEFEEQTGDVHPYLESQAVSSGETDLPTVPVCLVEETPYIGTLTIPSLGLTLPIQAAWDHDGAKYAPCRYQGTVQTGLILAGHNYSHHFGRIGSLAPGEPLTFTDAFGTSWQYEVAAVGTLSGSDIEEMVSSNYPLTLFTCTYSGRERVTVRCRWKAS